MALSNATVQADHKSSPSLAQAVSLLALDSVGSDPRGIMELFTQDYDVIGASSTAEALGILAQHRIGVLVARQGADEEEMLSLLRTLRDEYPFITVVLVSESPDSRMLVKLINQAEIYRFATAPVSPAVFRLAISAAMKEHERRLADPRLLKRAASVVTEPPLDKFADAVIKNLDHLNDIW